VGPYNRDKERICTEEGKLPKEERKEVCEFIQE